MGTDCVKPNRRLPQRFTRLAKAFNVNRSDSQVVTTMMREVAKSNGKQRKAGEQVKKIRMWRIQRLTTPTRLRRRRHIRSEKKRKIERKNASKAEALAAKQQEASKKK